jgi:hypothetical protein
MTSSWKSLFLTGRISSAALQEQQACIREISVRLAPYLFTPEGTPPEYSVRPAALPEDALSWRKNLFSTLFQSVYHLMDIPVSRRMLYGKLIHLYRIWVTSADNLLDEEDKDVVPMVMPGSARIIRQVVAVMAADRVLAEILNEGVERHGLTLEQRDALFRESLRRLLPSAAQEATEEGGIVLRPPPEEVLSVIHRLKTGLLFHLAFIGPEIVELPAVMNRAAPLHEGLMNFGLGCQVLDDLRDMARDLLERRHNYVLSVLTHQHPALLEELGGKTKTPDDRLYLVLPQEILISTARLGLKLLSSGLRTLGEAGLGYDRQQAERMAEAMFPLLDLEDVQYG